MADSPLFFLCQSPFAKLLAKLVFFVDFFPAVHALLCSPGLEAEPSSRFWGGIGPEPLVESSSRLAYVELNGKSIYHFIVKDMITPFCRKYLHSTLSGAI
ncbi:hypothetical protein SDJN03_29135, partial [Cucurbita argyrosperma subsp. sororia]